MQARDALMAGDTSTALAGFGDAAARNPNDPNAQTLLALTYHAAAKGDPETLDLAAAGYDLALRSDQDAFWAAALAGKAVYDRGRYDEAQAYFARAVMMRPDNTHALLALSMSAYMSGDPKLAALTAERVTQLPADARTHAEAVRLSGLSYAATGRKAEAWQSYARYAELRPDAAAPMHVRISDLVRTEDAAMPISDGPQVPLAPDQISVDVAIILSQTSQRDSIGINLLDGLTAQYGLQSQRATTGDAQGNRNMQRTVTEAISIPQLTYNMNLFNRFGQYYQVVARPMLTAYRGEPADFFVGRSAKVAVTGVNFSQLETIDIGTQIKVTPVEITAVGTRLRIEVTRSFLSGEPAGNFNEALNTWRQTVSTTVEVAFGTTLILSGLSESVRDSSTTKTPLLGDVPMVGSAFNRRITTDKRDAVLVLVTPSPSMAFAGPQWARPAQIEQLIGQWSTVIAPGSDLGQITGKLARGRLFTRARKDDARLTWPDLPNDQGEILKDLLLP
ncbi:tetratricopeptide repeat protein [Asticcacaulis sp. AC402]|uniref:tetratricopeptide repeat protein n=1 Tax=Asticcacaulis sp. AC402 TaxID=1282361 RepID=UPI0003C3CB15|nr:tetratricopeptide repeat protein [Asticcacaulis sp. AC402]ESQ75290.1 secretion protein [Asticcacaulis sp. AC402]